MVRKINLNGMERKELVKVIEQIIGKKGVYLKPPTFIYRIEKILVLKDGSVQCPDDSDIFERLAEWSIFCEPEELELTVELPDTLTEEQKDILGEAGASFNGSARVTGKMGTHLQERICRQLEP